METRLIDSMVKITHVGQTHKGIFPEKDTPEACEEVVRSQYLVMQIILQHPEHIVLKEGLSHDVVVNPENRSAVQRVMEQIFPGLVIPKYADLNLLQKKYLYDFGGAQALLCMGRLPCIYKTIDEETSQLIGKEIRDAISRGENVIETLPALVITVRENQSIHWSKEAFRQTGNPNVLLVFGENHNMRAAINALNDPAVSFYRVINTSCMAPDSEASTREQKAVDRGSKPSLVISSSADKLRPAAQEASTREQTAVDSRSSMPLLSSADELCSSVQKTTITGILLNNLLEDYHSTSCLAHCCFFNSDRSVAIRELRKLTVKDTITAGDIESALGKDPKSYRISFFNNDSQCQEQKPTNSTDSVILVLRQHFGFSA